MRHPHRWRSIGLGFFSSGIVAAPAAFLIPEGFVSDTIVGLLFVYGVMALLFGGMVALIRHTEARAWESLRRGENIIARWHVDGATWRAFLALNDRISEGSLLKNELTLYLRKDPPAEGVDVIVSRNGVAIDGDFHHLPPHGVPHVEHVALVRGDVSYVDLSLFYPGGGRGASGIPQRSVRTALRFPIGQNQEREGEHAFAHYNRDLPGAPDFFHGHGDGTDPEDLSRCYACGYETYKYIRTCPRCGTSMQSRRWSRRFGWGLAVCGLIMTGMMAPILYYTVPLLLQPGVAVTGTRFSGTAQQAWLVLGVLGAVFTFGAATLVYGIWQICTGQRDKKVVYFAVGVAAALFLTAMLL